MKEIESFNGKNPALLHFLQPIPFEKVSFQPTIKWYSMLTLPSDVPVYLRVVNAETNKEVGKYDVTNQRTFQLPQPLEAGEYKLRLRAGCEQKIVSPYVKIRVTSEAQIVHPQERERERERERENLVPLSLDSCIHWPCQGESMLFFEKSCRHPQQL